MKIQQFSHEKELLEKRIEQLTSSMTSTQICCSLTGITVQSVAELEKIQRLEFDRQSALDDLGEIKDKYSTLQKLLDSNADRFAVREYPLLENS